MARPGILLLALAACMDRDLATEPAVEAQSVIAGSDLTLATYEAWASVADAADRVLPVLEDAGIPAGLRDALANLSAALASNESAATYSELARAQAAIDAIARTAATGLSAEIDAIELALAAVQRTM